jgi:hypothetical protein
MAAIAALSSARGCVAPSAGSNWASVESCSSALAFSKSPDPAM